jgi:hypothetical protein
MEKARLQKLNEVEDKEQYQVDISNRFAAWKNLDEDVDMSTVCGTNRI